MFVEFYDISISEYLQFFESEENKPDPSSKNFSHKALGYFKSTNQIFLEYANFTTTQKEKKLIFN